jgi:hypothetical protein
MESLCEFLYGTNFTNKLELLKAGLLKIEEKYKDFFGDTSITEYYCIRFEDFC